jgi:hypothetical protein
LLTLYATGIRLRVSTSSNVPVYIGGCRLLRVQSKSSVDPQVLVTTPLEAALASAAANAVEYLARCWAECWVVARRTAAGSGLASLIDLDGDGNPLDDIIEMAGKLSSQGIRSTRPDKAKAG